MLTMPPVRIAVVWASEKRSPSSGPSPGRPCGRLSSAARASASTCSQRASLRTDSSAMPASTAVALSASACPGVSSLTATAAAPSRPCGPQCGERGTAACPYREDQLTGAGDRRILRVQQCDAADLHVQSGGCGLEFHQGLAQRQQQLAQADSGRGWRCRRGWIHDRCLCRVRVAWAHRAAGHLAGTSDHVTSSIRSAQGEPPPCVWAMPTVLMLSGRAIGAVAEAVPPEDVYAWCRR